MNFRMNEKVNVIRAVAIKDYLLAELTTNNFGLGESLDLDTEKARIQGQIVDKRGNWIKLKIANIIEKGGIYV